MYPTNNQEVITVADLSEAASLRASGCALVDVVSTQSGRCTFLFADETGEASAALRAHRLGTLTVSSIKLLESLSSLRTMIFSSKQGGF